MGFCGMTAAEIADGVRAQKWSAVEVLEAHLARVKEYDGQVNAVVTLSEEYARDMARRVDQAVARGEDPGLLCGVPYLVKDNFCVEGMRTTCGSKILENWISPCDSTAVKYFNEAGGVLMGKTNMDEFAMGSTTESSIFGPTLNPRDRSRVPGGSSGGSAAAVAMGYCPIALGSDTGGSVRQPAAFCGVQGMKPSYGQVSRFGIVGYVSSLDQVGPIARSVEDIALALQVLARGDENDSTCDAYEREDFTRAVETADLNGKKIAVLAGFDCESIDKPLLDAVERSTELCRAAGAEITEARLPITIRHGVACYYMVALGDASSKMACYDGIRYGLNVPGKNLTEMYRRSRNSGFGREVRRRILIGTCILTRGYYDNYYVPATKVRQMIADEFKQLFSGVDAILCPISPAMPYKKGLVEEDPIRVYLSDAFTTIANLAGLPSISLNAGFTSEGLPVAAQLIGPRFGDLELLSAAAVLERAIGRPEIAEREGEGR